MSAKNIKIILAIVILLLGAAGAVLGVVKIVQTRQKLTSQQPTGEIFSGTKTAAYYFHQTGRCVTCNIIGSTAETTIREDFARQLKDGTLEWKLVDYEAPENNHFQKMFDLSGPTLIVMNIKDGRVGQWRRLDRMWELRRDVPALKRYIRGQVEAMLAGTESKAAVLAPAEAANPLAPSWGQPFLEQQSGEALMPASGVTPPQASETADRQASDVAASTAALPSESESQSDSRGFWVLLWVVFGLGIFTSISPCPLATNIAAVSFIGKQIESKKGVLWSGLMYSVGRAVVYVVLAGIILAGLFKSSIVSNFLNDYLNVFVGPLLLLVAPLILGWIGGRLTFIIGSDKLHQRFAKAGGLGALMLGMLFALSLCPISAGIFFGPFLLAAAEVKSSVLFPAVYGIATGLPVFGFALVIAFASNYLGKTFHHLTEFEKWARLITGVIFILVGIYLTLIYTLGI